MTDPYMTLNDFHERLATYRRRQRWVALAWLVLFVPALAGPLLLWNVVGVLGFVGGLLLAVAVLALLIRETRTVNHALTKLEREVRDFRLQQQFPQKPKRDILEEDDDLNYILTDDGEIMPQKAKRG